MNIEKIKISKNEILSVLVIFLVAAFFRFYNLNELPVFADEAIYIRWAQVMRAETTLRFLPLSDGKQPLFMWMVIPFLKVIGDPLVAGRLVSGFAGLASLMGVIIATYILFKSKKASIMAGLLYAISPYMVYFDRMALVDSLLAMFGIWFFIFLVMAVRKIRLDLAMLAGFTLGGALLTKSPALYFVLLLPTTLLVSDISRKDYKAKFIKVFLLWMVTLGIGYAMFNILRLGPNFHMLSARNMDYVYPITHILEDALNPFLSHLTSFINYLWLLGPGVLILMLIGGLIEGAKNNKKESLLLGLWIILPLFSILIYSKGLTARYLLFILPFVFILASQMFISKKKIINRLAIVFVLIFTVQSLYINYTIVRNIERTPIPAGDRSGYLEEWSAGGGIKEASELIIKKHGEGETIVVGTEGYFGTLPDGMQIYLNNYPDITVMGIGLDLREVPQELIESAKSGNDTYLLINNTRLLIDDPAGLGLQEVGEYPKPKREVGSSNYEKYGPQEKLLLYKVITTK